EVIGAAKPPSNSKLGDKVGASLVDKKHSGVSIFDCEVPFATKEEADALAKAILQERMMRFITGRASSRGNPAIRAGIVVTLEASDRRFDGKYYVTSVRHRYRHQGGHGGGFTTDFDFR